MPTDMDEPLGIRGVRNPPPASAQPRQSVTSRRCSSLSSQPGRWTAPGATTLGPRASSCWVAGTGAAQPCHATDSSVVSAQPMHGGDRASSWTQFVWKCWFGSFIWL